MSVPRAPSLLSEHSDCGRVVLKLLSRGHAVLAELQRVADCLPPALRGEHDPEIRLVTFSEEERKKNLEEAQYYMEVLPDFSIYREEGAAERRINTTDKVRKDEASKEIHFEPAKRLYKIFAAIKTYWQDLARFLEDLEDGVFINYNLQGVMRDEHGCQLIPEAVSLLGNMLLITEERLPAQAREKSLVAFHQFIAGTYQVPDDFGEICMLFKESSRPLDGDFARRDPGLEYPESFFKRFSLPEESLQIIIGNLQTGDIYHRARHYPLPEHRSHSLAAQAGILYVLLYFHPETLQTNIVAMREIVNRHFGDAWVLAYALGFTADLLSMWAPYPAAREAMSQAISEQTVRILRDQHLKRLKQTKEQLANYLTEGALSENVILEDTQKLLSCLRQANTTIRWLLLQPTTQHETLRKVFLEVDNWNEPVLTALVDTALLEDKVGKLLGGLVARRDKDWSEQKLQASEMMQNLSVFYSGSHPLRNAERYRNEELEGWFSTLDGKIQELSFETEEDLLTLGRNITRITAVLEKVENYHDVASNPQILHFLSDTRKGLKRMARTVNLSEEMVETTRVVADLSYAWKALEQYRSDMEKLLGQTQSEYKPGSVRGLRALFLKLACIVDVPMKRKKSYCNEMHESIILHYYSTRLEKFMREVLQEIPRQIFSLLGQVAEQKKAKAQSFQNRIVLGDLQEYARDSDESREEVGRLTQQIAQFMRGIRETQATDLGVIRVEPNEVLVTGLRHELARKIEDVYAALNFGTGKLSSRESLTEPLEKLAAKGIEMCAAFENVQDYVGVSALELWHTESGRIMRFLLHMEQQYLLQHRWIAQQSPYHVPECPILFPDKWNCDAGRSVISRTLTALTQLTDPRTTVGGWHGEWRRKDSGETTIDGHSLQILHRALGSPGVAAVHRFLGIRLAGRLKTLMNYFRDHESEHGLAAQDWETLRAEASKVRAANDACDEVAKTLQEAADSLRALAGRWASVNVKLLDRIAFIGQHQLLRRRLAMLLNLRSRIDAPLAAEALSALDGSELTEAVDCGEIEDGLDLPSLGAFVDDGPGQEEFLRSFHRQITRATELSGLGNTLRQIFITVPQGSLPTGMDMLITVILLTAANRAERKVVEGPSRKAATFSPDVVGGDQSFVADETHSFVSAPLGLDGAGELVESRTANPMWGVAMASKVKVVDATPLDANAPLLVGLATLLQQVPRACTDGWLDLTGTYLAGLTSSREQNSELMREGAHLCDFTSELLEMLGLPREQLAEFIPQGLLDLWPREFPEAGA